MCGNCLKCDVFEFCQIRKADIIVYDADKPVMRIPKR